MSSPLRFTPLEMLERLVAFDTTSRNSNLELIDFVEDYLRLYGVESERVANADGSKANLFATIGPKVSGGVILSGHTDVVPVDGQDWTTEPFVLTRKDDGRVFGRGTSDMKAFSATALALVPEFLEAKLERPIHLALSYDEEVGCLGAPALVQHIAKQKLRPSLAIIGEPTMMRVVDAHKGVRSFHVTVTGHEAHSSRTHEGVSAVMVAAELIMHIKALADDMKRRGDPTGRFDPPYSSTQASVIQGGTALNILAKTCTFSFEYRTLPDADDNEIKTRFTDFAMNDVLPRIRAVAPACNIEIRQRSHVPPLRPAKESPAEALALALTGANASEAVSYATEAGIFQQADFPSIVCGPGDIAQAHKPNEFIDIAQVDLCETFMRKLARRLAG
jgi:acetylornithine deacetylase